MKKIRYLFILLLLSASSACAHISFISYREDPVAVLSWLVYVISVAGAVVFFSGTGTDDEALSEGAAGLMILAVFWGILSFFTIAFLYSALFIVLGLLGLSLGKSALSLAKSRGKVIDKRPNLAFLLILMIILVQGNLFGWNEEGISTVTTGWITLEPLTQTIVYSAYANGVNTFSATFENVVGTSIKITNVSVTEHLTNTTCSPATSNDGTAVNTTIPIRGTFRIGVNCISAGKVKGDMYDMEITIEYFTMTGNITARHIENGRIRGPVEA